LELIVYPFETEVVSGISTVTAMGLEPANITGGRHLKPIASSPKSHEHTILEKLT
jgi:hypothetical protein